jgi:hypothetical protein
VSDRGNVRMPETSEAGEASEEEPAVQSIARQEGMSDHVSDESEAREANLEAANQTLEGQMESSYGQALRACEGHTGESQVCCEGESMDERESTAAGNAFPNYAAPMSTECVWDETSSMGNKLSNATCESSKERKLQAPAELERVREVCNAVASSERVVESSACEPREDSHIVHDFNLNPAKGQIPGVRWSKVPVLENLREAQRSPQWEFWRQAMQEEQDSLEAHEVMEYVERPRGGTK